MPATSVTPGLLLFFHKIEAGGFASARHRISNWSRPSSSWPFGTPTSRVSGASETLRRFSVFHPSFCFRRNFSNNETIDHASHFFIHPNLIPLFIEQATTYIFAIAVTVAAAISQLVRGFHKNRIASNYFHRLASKNRGAITFHPPKLEIARFDLSSN